MAVTRNEKWISLLFLISGATGLIFETLWIRLLSDKLGSATGMGLVVAVFFVGLSLGSYIAARYADLISKPLQMYGFLEALVGLSTFAIWNPLTRLNGVANAATVLEVGLLILIPTVSMGMTLPVLVRARSRNAEAVGETVSRLYAVNTLGAVFGAIATGYFLVPGLGIAHSNFLTSALNVLLGSFALILAIHETRLGHTVADTFNQVGHFWPGKSWKAGLRLTALEYSLLFSTAISGFAGMTIEVIWNQALNSYFGNTSYGVSLVLAIFLVGISLGSFVLSMVHRRIREPLFLYGALFSLVSVLLLLSSLFFGKAIRFADVVQVSTGSPLTALLLRSLLASSILIWPIAVFGALLPLAISVFAAENADRPSRAVGYLCAANTVGGIFGCYLSGFFLIPHFGILRTLQFVVLLLLVTAAWLFRKSHPSTFLRWTYAAVQVIVALICISRIQFAF